MFKFLVILFIFDIFGDFEEMCLMVGESSGNIIVIKFVRDILWEMENEVFDLFIYCL